MSEAQLPPERRTYALGLRLLAITGFSVMSVAIKLASDRGASLPEIVFWRQALAMPIILLVLWQGPGLASVKTSRLGAHALRSVLGLTCMVFNFASIMLLPLAESTTLGFAAPIFATVLGVLVYGEQVGIRRAGAIFIGFIGVVIVAQPSGAHLNIMGTAAGLTAAALVALVSFQIRDLGRTELATTSVFWFTTLSTLGMAFFLPVVWQPHDVQTWLILLAVGTIGGLSQFAMASSLRYAPVSSVVGMDYISLIWASLAGWLIWSQLPTGATWFGASIIIASGLYIALREHQLSIERARSITV